MTTVMQHMSTSQAGLLSTQGGQTTGSSLWNMSLLSPFERISRAAFTLIVLAVLTIATVCVVDAVRLVGQPFPGFLVSERLMAANFGLPDWSGPQKGIKFTDRLREADGTTLSSFSDLEEVVRRTPVGQTIRYVLERDGQQVEIAIPTMRFTWVDLGLTFGPTFSAGLIYLVIAIVVYVLKPDTAVTWALVLSCFLLGTYQILTFGVGSSHRFVGATLAVYAMLPGAGLHLSLMFPERKRLIERWKFIQFAPYVVSVVLAAIALWLYPGPSFENVYLWMRVYTLLSVAAILVAVLHAFFRSASFLARQRAKVVLFGALLAFPIPAVVNSLSFVSSTPGSVQLLSTFVPFPLLLFPVSIGYAIARHNLFDVDVYLKRTVGYMMMTACVAGAYFALQTVVRTSIFDPLLGSATEQVYPLLFALVTVFAFNPLSRAVQGAVDKLFYRGTSNYKATVASVSEALSSVVNLKDFLYCGLFE